MTVCPDHELELHAMADGKLDSAARIALEAHLRVCADCSAELARLEVVDGPSPESTPQHPGRRSLRAAMKAMLPLARTESSFARDGRGIGGRTARWLGGGAIGVLGAIAVLLVGMPEQNTSGLEDELVAAHVRSLSAPRLTDVQATDRQGGKPWFDRRIGFSPTVVDLSAAGFPLMGTRVDRVGGQQVAVLVYGTSLHPITLFVRPKPQRTSPLSSILRNDRFSMLRWEYGDLEFFTVSDVQEADLKEFRSTFRQASEY